MPGNPTCTVYVGNLDERVSERVLYDILIQVGRIVDLYIPRDRETDRPKGYAFAEYETEEIADYAVKLFSGLVTLYNRTLKFGISGQDNSSQNMVSSSSKSRSHHMENFQNSINLGPSYRPPAYHMENSHHMENFQNSINLGPSYRPPAYLQNYSEEPPPPGVEVEKTESIHYKNEIRF